VGGAHLGDVLAAGELMRDRLDPRPTDPLQLLAAILEDVGKLLLFAGLAHRREPSA
jgi:hypothetical protein